MKIKNPFSDLTKFERALWLSSVCVIALSFIISGGGDVMTLISSLMGVTALIFVAKGYVIGQVFTVIFSVFYGIVSFFFRYYGEMITYLCMSAPSALFSVFAWLRHPYKGTKEIEINKITKKNGFIITIATIAVTTAFYFILAALGNANLTMSTVSIATSFSASMLLMFRSPYYAIAYAANDIVLIILWVMASIKNISYLPMIFCFVMFLLNDLYGFYNWGKMRKRQQNKI